MNTSRGLNWNGRRRKKVLGIIRRAHVVDAPPTTANLYANGEPENLTTKNLCLEPPDPTLHRPSLNRHIHILNDTLLRKIPSILLPPSLERPLSSRSQFIHPPPLASYPRQLLPPSPPPTPPTRRPSRSPDNFTHHVAAIPPRPLHLCQPRVQARGGDAHPRRPHPDPAAPRALRRRRPGPAHKGALDAARQLSVLPSEFFFLPCLRFTSSQTNTSLDPQLVTQLEAAIKDEAVIVAELNELASKHPYYKYRPPPHPLLPFRSDYTH